VELDEDMLTAIPEVEQPLIEGPKFDEFMKVDPVCAAVSNIKFSLSNIQGDDMDFDALPSFSL